MRIIVLDGAEMLTREAAHNYLARRLALPDHYGRNLDALYDCLTEIGEETLAVLYRREVMAAALGDCGEALLQTLRDAAGENPRLLFAVDGEDK